MLSGDWIILEVSIHSRNFYPSPAPGHIALPLCDLLSLHQQAESGLFPLGSVSFCGPFTFCHLILRRKQGIGTRKIDFPQCLAPLKRLVHSMDTPPEKCTVSLTCCREVWVNVYLPQTGHQGKTQVQQSPASEPMSKTQGHLLEYNIITAASLKCLSLVWVTTSQSSIGTSLLLYTP